MISWFLQCTCNLYGVSPDICAWGCAIKCPWLYFSYRISYDFISIETHGEEKLVMSLLTPILCHVPHYTGILCSRMDTRAFSHCDWLPVRCNKKGKERTPKWQKNYTPKLAAVKWELLASFIGILLMVWSAYVSWQQCSTKLNNTTVPWGRFINV